MFDRLQYIELSGERYPLKCDLLVLEKIQDEYKDISEAENRLTGFVPDKNEDGTYVKNDDGYIIGHYGMPDVKVLNQMLHWMVSEGFAVESDEKKLPIRDISKEELIRKIDMSPRELSDTIHEEFNRCFKRKNEKTTQN
ncbi:MAG: hypothetical protein SOY12_00645 [Schaedlerella sp.]|nr:hypothetical protein [Lachnospiraceae bacterium]MDY4201568.1 hypothetical protein [Schaedlerella sp.]